MFPVLGKFSHCRLKKDKGSAAHNQFSYSFYSQFLGRCEREMAIQSASYAKLGGAIVGGRRPPDPGSPGIGLPMFGVGLEVCGAQPGSRNRQTRGPHVTRNETLGVGLVVIGSAAPGSRSLELKQAPGSPVRHGTWVIGVVAGLVLVSGGAARGRVPPA